MVIDIVGGVAQRQHRVVISHRAEVNGNLFSAQGCRNDESVFQQFPRQFERQSLPRVHGAGLVR